jgi:dTDP-4-amino-4,6-dideoxygalactose transaminase
MTLFDDHVPLLRPCLGESEVEAVREVILSGWVSQGPIVAQFERAVADFVGAAWGVATNSATSALHLALLVSGINPGDEVICPATTCMATANAICHVRATPVFADIEPDTFNIDPVHTAQLITQRTRAIMMVHQIGLPASLDELTALATDHDLKIIEDAATAVGATYKGQYLGASGNPTCYSFHPRKMITTGEGGMMMTGSQEQADRARVLRSAGASISDLVRHEAKGVLQQVYREVGYNYRLTDIQAAIGLVQLTRLPEMLQQRRKQAVYYDEHLAKLDEVRCPHVPTDRTHCYSSYCIQIRPGSRRSRDEVLESMANKGISCRRGIPPLYAEPYFRQKCGDLVLPVSEQVGETSMFLPIFPGLGPEDLGRVLTALKESLA